MSRRAIDTLDGEDTTMAMSVSVAEATTPADLGARAEAAGMRWARLVRREGRHGAARACDAFQALLLELTAEGRGGDASRVHRAAIELAEGREGRW